MSLSFMRTRKLKYIAVATTLGLVACQDANEMTPSRAAAAEDTVLRVRRAARAPRVVRRSSIHCVRDRLLEVQLRRELVRRPRAVDQSDLEVQVRRATRVPARIDRLKPSDAIASRGLEAA
jgi:hypothetical protein